MTPVVFVHGFLGGSRQWRGQVEAFSEVDVVTVDLPGFGENAHLEALSSIPAFGRWVLDTLAAQGIDRFQLIGHSMGGMVAQEMVAQAPERVAQLVLYGTGPTGDLPGRFETIETSKERARADGSQATARRIAATWFLRETEADAYEECASIAEQTGMDAIMAGLDAMQAWDGAARLAEIETPTLVVWGDHDRTYDWRQTERLWRTIRNAGLAVLPNCAHATHLEKPFLFNSVVGEFLATSDRPAGLFQKFEEEIAVG